MAAEKSMGTTLEVGATAIAGLTSIGAFGVSSTEIDITSLDSPDGYKEFLLSLKDSGEVPIKGFVKDDTNMDELFAIAEAQTLEDCVVTFLSGVNYTFEAYVKEFKEAETTVEGARGFEGSLRISGKVDKASEVSA